MGLTPSQVHHVALLARIGLKEGEEEYFGEQLSGILEHIDRLREVDTSNIPPTAQAVPLAGGLRADEVRPGLGREAALAPAPARRDSYFLVPAIQDPEP